MRFLPGRSENGPVDCREIVTVDKAVLLHHLVHGTNLLPMTTVMQAKMLARSLVHGTNLLPMTTLPGSAFACEQLSGIKAFARNRNGQQIHAQSLPLAGFGNVNDNTD